MRAQTFDLTLCEPYHPTSAAKVALSVRLKKSCTCSKALPGKLTPSSLLQTSMASARYPAIPLSTSRSLLVAMRYANPHPAAPPLNLNTIPLLAEITVLAMQQ